MGRKRVKHHVQVGESYDLIRVGDTYFLKGADGVLRQADVILISDEEARRLMDMSAEERE